MSRLGFPACFLSFLFACFCLLSLSLSLSLSLPVLSPRFCFKSNNNRDKLFIYLSLSFLGWGWVGGPFLSPFSTSLVGAGGRVLFFSLLLSLYRSILSRNNSYVHKFSCSYSLENGLPFFVEDIFLFFDSVYCRYHSEMEFATLFLSSLPLPLPPASLPAYLSVFFCLCLSLSLRVRMPLSLSL